MKYMSSNPRTQTCSLPQHSLQIRVSLGAIPLNSANPSSNFSQKDRISHKRIEFLTNFIHRRKHNKSCKIQTIVQKMVLCYPSTPKKLAMTVACFLGGASLFYVGLQLSYKNIAPQQARIKARNDFVRERLKQKYGYEGPTLRKG